MGSLVPKKTSTIRRKTRRVAARARLVPTASAAGFTLIEVIVVITLMAATYGIMAPNFFLRSGVEAAGSISQLAEDIRSAYETAVLTGKTHRLVFHMASGDYWLEKTDARHVFLSSNVEVDPSPSEEEERQADFDREFLEYEDLAGRIVVDPDSDTEIPPTSPVLKAKEVLRGPSWNKVDSPEWDERSLGPVLVIKTMQAEHHGRMISVTDQHDLGIGSGYGFVYIFARGYVERAMIHIYFRDGDRIDENIAPYTVVTQGYSAEAEVRVGYHEIEFHEAG